MAAPTFLCEVAFAHAPGLSYETAVLDDAPNGYWRLGDLTDETLQAGSLTEVAGPIPSVAGLLATDTSVARDLNGSTQYWTAADGTFTDLGDVFTFECWAVFDAVANQQLFSKDAGAPGVFLDSGGVFTLSKAGTATIAQGGTLLTGTVYHLVATKNGATFKMYVNGVDVTTTVGNQTCTNTAAALNIGRNTAGTNFVNGRLAHPAIYPTLLSAARVRAHYEAGLPTWTNVTQYMLGFATKRGRQKELDRIDAGTATVRFNNSDRRFDPSHTSSPYYPNVKPRRRLRISAVHNSVTYRLFTGFVQSWPQSWQGPNVGFTDVNVTDAFLPLSRADVGENTTWPRELSGARITRVLDLAGWSSADRSIDAGQSEIAETTFALGSGVTALDHIREVAGAELGAFFCDGAGRAVFHDRYHRKAAAYFTSQATFGDVLSGGLPYQSVILDTDDGWIFNDIQVTAVGGETQRVEDSASRYEYGRNTMARQVPLARDTEAADQGAELLARYKDPQNRLAGIMITPATDALWVQALARELGDHITVKRHPQGVGSLISQECSVETVEHSWTPRGGDFGLTTTWLLSTPAYTEVNWWLLGNATYGKLGTTTVMSY